MYDNKIIKIDYNLLDRLGHDELLSMQSQVASNNHLQKTSDITE